MLCRGRGGGGLEFLNDLIPMSAERLALGIPVPLETMATLFFSSAHLGLTSFLPRLSLASIVHHGGAVGRPAASPFE